MKTEVRNEIVLYTLLSHTPCVCLYMCVFYKAYTIFLKKLLVLKRYPLIFVTLNTAYCKWWISPLRFPYLNSGYKVQITQTEHLFLRGIREIPLLNHNLLKTLGKAEKRIPDYRWRVTLIAIVSRSVGGTGFPFQERQQQKCFLNYSNFHFYTTL